MNCGAGDVSLPASRQLVSKRGHCKAARHGSGVAACADLVHFPRTVALDTLRLRLNNLDSPLFEVRTDARAREACWS